VPFRLSAHRRRSAAPSALLLFVIALEPRHRYGVVVTRRAATRRRAVRPSVLEVVRDAARSGELVGRARARREVLAAAAAATPSTSAPTWHRGSLRSAVDPITDDLGRSASRSRPRHLPRRIARVVAEAQTATG
jgi:hypothetical protein